MSVDPPSSRPGVAAEPLVGRVEELAALRAALDEAGAGRGRLVLVGGEPGMGKTRLIRELAAEAGSGGVEVLWGRAWQEDGAPAFWPWVQVLRAWIAERDDAELLGLLGADAAVVGHLVPDVAERLPDLVAPTDLDPAQARFRFFDAVSRLLKRAALERRLMILLDDLHQADTPSLLLLQFLARELAGARLLVVGTYRRSEAGRGQAVSRTLSELIREPATRRIDLAGLSEAELARLVELEGGVAPSRVLVSLLHERTGGNPFFVGEMVRLLAQDGQLERLQPSDDAVIRIPEAVRDLVCERLAPLGADARAVLELGAVVGREFNLAVLGRVADLGQDALLDALDEAVDLGLIATDAASVDLYRFAHALTRDTLYDQVSRSRRARLHRQVAEALEVVHAADPGPHLAELGHHFARARLEPGDRRAIVYARRAGQRALDLLAYEEAVRLFAVALGQESDEVERGQLLLALADAQLRAGQASEARETFAQAGASARLLAEPELLARAAIGLAEATAFAWLDVESAFDRLIGLLEEALRALGERSPALRASVLSHLATAMFWRSWTDPRGRQDLHERARALSGDAVAAARAAADPIALASALDTRYYAFWTPHNLTERVAIAEEIVALAEARGDNRIALLGRSWRIVNAAESGDASSLDREIAACARLAEQSRQPIHLLRTTLWQAMRALLQGRFEEAEALHGRAQTIATGLTSHSVELQYARLVQSWLLARERGQLGQLEGPIAEVVRHSPGLVGFRCMLTQIYAANGRLADAARELDALAEGGFAAVPPDASWLVTMTALAEAALALDDAARARTLYGLLLPFRNRCGVVAVALACTGAVSLWLGRLAGWLGDREAAAEHLEAAIAINARMAARPYLADSQLERARLLHERARSGDQERAAELAGQAAATARELGMTSLLERLRGSGLLDAGAPAMPQIEIDRTREAHDVAEVTRSAYFRQLRERAEELRRSHASDT